MLGFHSFASGIVKYPVGWEWYFQTHPHQVDLHCTETLLHTLFHFYQLVNGCKCEL